MKTQHTTPQVLSSRDFFILTSQDPKESDLTTRNIDNAVYDDNWFYNLYEESGDHLKDYMDRIKRIPVLKREEERRLAELAKLGNEKALEKMIHHNLRLVVWVAMKYRGRLYASHGMELMDLIQEGNLGLVMKAVKRFDPSLGFKFSTYAQWWIRQFISRSLDEKSRTINLPVNLSVSLRAYNKTLQKLTVMLLREPTLEEIAEESKMPVEKIELIQGVLRQTSIARILSQYQDDGNENRFQHFQIRSHLKDSEEILHEKDLRRQLTKLLKMTLNVKEYEIFVMRHGLNGNGGA